MHDNTIDDEDDSAAALIVPPELEGQRLDKVLATLCGESFSRARLQTLIEEGQVRIDGTICTLKKHPVSAGQTLDFDVPEAVPATLQPENIPLDIVFEDDDLIVLNKPAGLVVHPGAGHWSGTLVNALLHHCKGQLSGIGGVARPGIVHRLDMETSGLMLAAKTDRAHRALSAQLADRTLSRTYLALALGVPLPLKGSVDQPIGRHPVHRQKMAVIRKGGKEARTFYHVQKNYAGMLSLIACTLESGRTHQIRVHMSWTGYPLIGDPLYGPQPTALGAALRKGGFDEATATAIRTFPRQALHAAHIAFVHPVTEEEMEFEADPPADMMHMLEALESYNTLG